MVVTIRQAAAHMGVSVATVRREIKRGNIPAWRVGRSVRINSCDLPGGTVERYLQEQAARKGGCCGAQ